jgi:hypothetical protein
MARGASTYERPAASTRLWQPKATDRPRRRNPIVLVREPEPGPQAEPEPGRPQGTPRGVTFKKKDR